VVENFKEDFSKFLSRLGFVYQIDVKLGNHFVHVIKLHIGLVLVQVGDLELETSFWMAVFRDAETSASFEVFLHLVFV
jgi:hypothetical protein